LSIRRFPVRLKGVNHRFRREPEKYAIGKELIPYESGDHDMQKITPFLWFDTQAEEAVNYYVSIFKNSKVVNVTRYGDDAAKVSGRPKGSVMTVAFQLDGQPFVALNGGPVFSFTPAISFMVDCKTQEEVDHLWDKLSAGGEQQQCGWLRDKYGVTWQIVPSVLGELMGDPDPAKSQRVMQAMLQMTRLDIKALQQAAGS
jgi:predicted 3-demethylubiquinone-9 3-methyltransferase (glyoxalase superfamily)